MSSNFTITLVLLAAIACLSQGCCPERFIQVGNRCYHYNSDKVDWNDAHHACVGLGAHLVSIHNAEDSKEVYALWKSLVDESYLNYGHRTYWIGLHDVQNENTFEWSDGTPMDYSLWHPSQPNNYGGEDCVAPFNYGSNDFDKQRWHDHGCRNRKPYFCRKSATS